MDIFFWKKKWNSNFFFYSLGDVILKDVKIKKWVIKFKKGPKDVKLDP